MKYKILPSAFHDLAKGRDFHDSRKYGLGDYFLDTMFSEIESLRVYGGIHRKEFGYHRLLTQKFPYAVYYQFKEGEIEVCRVLDCRRDPKYIRRKLSE